MSRAAVEVGALRREVGWADEAEPKPPSEVAPELVWRDEWARFRRSEFILVPVLGAAMITTGLVFPGKTNPTWLGRNGLDDATGLLNPLLLHYGLGRSTQDAALGGGRLGLTPIVGPGMTALGVSWTQ